MNPFFIIFSFLILVLIPGECISKNNINDLNQIKIIDLKTAGHIALAQNPSLSAARSRVQQAKHFITQARSTYWPRLDATVAYAYTDIATNTYEKNLATAKFFDPSTSIDNPDHYYNFALQASWILFNGFERKYSNLIARLGKIQAEHAHDDIKRLLLSSLSETYFAAQLAAQNIKIRIADEKFNKRLLEEAKARNRMGAGSLSDQMNFEIRVNSAKAQLLADKNTYQSTLYGLAALMGVEEATLPKHITLTELKLNSNVEAQTFNTQNLIDYAMENRMDLLGNDAAVKTFDAEIKKSKSNYFPMVKLSASIDSNRTGDAAFEMDDVQTSVAVGVSYNLFAGGVHRAGILNAQERRYEAIKRLKASRISIISEVRKAVGDVERAQKELFLQRSNAQLVGKNRDLVEKEYMAGKSSLVRLNEAQRDLITAQSRLAFALVSLQMAKLKLKTATGSIITYFME